MTDRGNALGDTTFGALLGRLADDGRRLVGAEIAVHVATVKCRINQSKPAVAMLAAALLLVVAAVIVALGGLGAFLARWIGPLGGGVAAALIALIVAAILAKVAIARLAPAPSPEVPVSVEDLAK